MEQDFSQQIAKLNPAQKQAVETIYGPVLLLAGPGSGKTHVIALRIANILKETDTNPNNILALTFTDNAAQNMRRRLFKLIGNQAYQLNIHTFHSFANQIIQEYPEYFSFTREATQLDDLTRVTILHEILNDGTFKLLRNSANPAQQLPNISSAISQIKRTGLTAEEFAAIVEKHRAYFEQNVEINKKGEPKTEWKTYKKTIDKNTELAEIYALFTTALKEQGLYDFDDMLIFVISALQNEDLKADLQERFQFHLVDEYQDTNGAQLKIITSLNSYDENPNIFAVGDEDQSIYSFQGANIKNVLDFKAMYPNAEIITTEFNYRSSQKILDLAQSLITHNPDRISNFLPDIEKKLRAGTEVEHTQIELRSFLDNQRENEFMVQEIKSLLDKGVPAYEIAVIYHNHADVADLAKLLAQEGIPFQSQSDASLLAEPIVRQLITLFKVINNLPANDNIAEALHLTALNLDVLEIQKLLAMFAVRQEVKQSLIEFILADSNAETVRFEIREAAKELKRLAEKALELSTLDLYFEILQSTGILNKYALSKDAYALACLKKFQDFITKRSKLSQEYNLGRLILDLQLLTDNKLKLSLPKLSGDTAAVQLLTAHAAKGLEFEYVFIFKLVDNHWGNKRSANQLSLLNFNDLGLPDKAQIKADKYSEDRRLLYVAFTRAKRVLSLNYSQKYVDGTEQKEKESNPSMFLGEVDMRLLTNIPASSIEPDLAKLMQPMPAAFANSEIITNRVKNLNLSYSALKDYLECELRFFYKYILKLPEPVSFFTVKGNAVHSALHLYFINGKKKELTPLGKLVAQAEGYLRWQQVTPQMREDILKDVAKILEKIYPHLAIPEKILHSEYKLTNIVQLSAGQEIPLTGTVDLISQSGVGEIHITDFKTSKPKQVRSFTNTSESLIEWHPHYLQLCFYTLLLEASKLFSGNQIKGSIMYLALGDDSKTATKELTATPSREDTSFVKEQLGTIWTKIQNQEFNTRCGKEECKICTMLNQQDQLQ